MAPGLAFFSLLALGIGLFLIYNNLAVTVLERRREIGLLRAAGATTSWIRNLFLLQAGMLGLLGTVLGFGAGGLRAAGLIGYLRQSGGQADLRFVFDPEQAVVIGLWGILATLLCALL